jgi:putative acetyltransferase
MSADAAIVVRRAQSRDAEAIAATFSTPAAMAGTLQLPFPSAATYVKWIDDMAPGDYMLVAEVGGSVVGNLGLHAAGKSPRRRHAGTLGMSVHDDFQRRGVGSALLAAAIDLADNWIGYARLELTVYTDNVAAVALYRKFGFGIEGTARAFALRNGAYVDAFMMARHAPVLPHRPAPDTAVAGNG